MSVGGFLGGVCAISLSGDFCLSSSFLFSEIAFILFCIFFCLAEFRNSAGGFWRLDQHKLGLFWL